MWHFARPPISYFARNPRYNTVVIFLQTPLYTSNLIFAYATITTEGMAKLGGWRTGVLDGQKWIC